MAVVLKMDLCADLSAQLGLMASEKKEMIATAESCTAGGIACAITQTAGSSEWFDRGFVTYSNESKEDLLGVKHETLQQYGAVSEQTASEMVLGALTRSNATLAVAVTGIAGPGGAVPGKPVGTVFFGVAIETAQGVHVCSHRCEFDGNRDSVRRQSIDYALRMLLTELQSPQ